MAATRRKAAAVMTLVPADTFGTAAANPELLHRTLTVHAQNARQGTQDSRTRGQVRGSGIKLFRQKGTGHARPGAAGAVHRRGGGIAFGPKPRTVERRIARNERRAALRGVLAAMARAGRLHQTESWGDSAKTKDRAAWLARTGLAGRVTLVDVEPSPALQRSARNIPGIRVARADTIAAYDVAVADHLIVTAAALTALQERGGHGSQ